MVFNTNLYHKFSGESTVQNKVNDIWKMIMAYIVLIMTLGIFVSLMYLILYKIPFGFIYMGFDCLGYYENCYTFTWYAFCLLLIASILLYSKGPEGAKKK